MNQRDKLLRDNAFREVKRYEPPNVAAVRARKGDKAADKMAAGIALDRARRRGAKI